LLYCVFLGLQKKETKYLYSPARQWNSDVAGKQKPMLRRVFLANKRRLSGENRIENEPS